MPAWSGSFCCLVLHPFVIHPGVIGELFPFNDMLSGAWSGFLAPHSIKYEVGMSVLARFGVRGGLSGEAHPALSQPAPPSVIGRARPPGRRRRRNRTGQLLQSRLRLRPAPASRSALLTVVVELRYGAALHPDATRRRTFEHNLNRLIDS